MSDKETQISLMFIEACLTFSGILFITPNVTFNLFILSIENSTRLNFLGWALIFIGFPLFLFGMAYPYLEAWRKSRLRGG